MSLGYEGTCKLIMQDEELAVYAYSGANVNDNYKLRKEHITKECFNAFRRYGSMDVDYIAYKLIYKIFQNYQENGCLPEKEGFIQ